MQTHLRRHKNPENEKSDKEAKPLNNVPCSTDRQEKITELLLAMITRDLQPISIVEDKGFCDLVSFLEPGYKMPCRKTVKQLLTAKHEKAQEHLKHKVQSEASSVCFTTDIWYYSFRHRKEF